MAFFDEPMQPQRPRARSLTPQPATTPRAPLPMRVAPNTTRAAVSGAVKMGQATTAPQFAGQLVNTVGGMAAGVGKDIGRALQPVQRGVQEFTQAATGAPARPSVQSPRGAQPYQVPDPQFGANRQAAPTRDAWTGTAPAKPEGPVQTINAATLPPAPAQPAQPLSLMDRQPDGSWKQREVGGGFVGSPGEPTPEMMKVNNDYWAAERQKVTDYINQRDLKKAAFNPGMDRVAQDGSIDTSMRQNAMAALGNVSQAAAQREPAKPLPPDYEGPKLNLAARTAMDESERAWADLERQDQERLAEKRKADLERIDALFGDDPELAGRRATASQLYGQYGDADKAYFVANLVGSPDDFRQNTKGAKKFDDQQLATAYWAKIQEQADLYDQQRMARMQPPAAP